MAVLDPDVTLRADGGPGGPAVIRGAAEVAVAGDCVPAVRRELGAGPGQRRGRPALGFRDGRPVSVFSPMIRDGRIVEINILADPERLARLDLRGLR